MARVKSQPRGTNMRCYRCETYILASQMANPEARTQDRLCKACHQTVTFFSQLSGWGWVRLERPNV